MTIPDSVTSIGYRAFNNCTHLAEVKLSVNWTETPRHEYSYQRGNIFTGCSLLLNLTLPEGMTAIPEYAFANSPALVTVTLPDSMRQIGYYAFGQCTMLGGVDLGKQLTTIGTNAFEGCSTLEDIIIPRSLSTIGNYAFNGCTSLGNVDLSSGLTSIGAYAFNNSGLLSIDIPQGVTAINDHTFTNCANLRNVYLRDTVASFSGNPFENSPNVVIHCTVDSAAYLFAIEKGIPYVLDEGLNLTIHVYLGDQAFIRYSGIESGCRIFAAVYDANGGMLALTDAVRREEDKYIELVLGEDSIPGANTMKILIFSESMEPIQPAEAFRVQ